MTHPGSHRHKVAEAELKVGSAVPKPQLPSPLPGEQRILLKLC